MLSLLDCSGWLTGFDAMNNTAHLLSLIHHDIYIIEQTLIQCFPCTHNQFTWSIISYHLIKKQNKYFNVYLHTPWICRWTSFNAVILEALLSQYICSGGSTLVCISSMILYPQFLHNSMTSHFKFSSPFRCICSLCDLENNIQSKLYDLFSMIYPLLWLRK